MQITPSLAAEVIARYERDGSLEAAAHQCSVELTAIEPYTCSHLTSVRSILRKLAANRYPTEAIAALRKHAAGGKPERYADADGYIRYR